MPSASELSWTFSSIWNESLAVREDKPVQPREHIWASELGGSFVDRWYKMKGVAPSNPYDPRSLRKFEAGKVFEWIVEMVLMRAGILVNKQEWVEFQYEGLPRVSGKLDHLAGGSPDWERARANLNGDTPDFIKRAVEGIVQHFSANYPDGLKPLVIEVKSVGSQMFHRYTRFGVAEPKHRLQLFHYLKAKGMDEGHIIYISKDDLCLAEIAVVNPSWVEEEYRADIERMNEFLKASEPPPAEKPIDFGRTAGRFALNWKVGYSLYLTKVYGFPNQAEFTARYEPLVASWNRVLGRVVKGQKMTEGNKQAIEEIKRDFPNFDELVEVSKKISMEEVEGEEDLLAKDKQKNGGETNGK